MAESDGLSPGDEWPHHYRGLSLQANPDKTVWWQLYQGTDRLTLEPAPDEIVTRLLRHKPIGGRMHITEQGDVLTRVEDGDEYEQLYLGTLESMGGELVPPDKPEYSIELRPTGLETGDLWPSIYDGSRYSFAGNRVWWQNGDSHKRHRVPDGLPSDIERGLRQYKPKGGSFRVLPWGDIITLVPLHPTPSIFEEQFNNLPTVVRNIIKLRKERDVEMLPIYVDSLDGYQIEIEEPTSITDDLSEREEEELNSWAKNLGRTSSRSAENHRVESRDGEHAETDTNADTEDDLPNFDDDPVEWGDEADVSRDNSSDENST